MNHKAIINLQIEELVERLPNIVYTFDDFYYKNMSLMIAFNKHIQYDVLINYMEDKKDDLSLVELHKLSVFYNVFFKNDPLLNSIIVKRLKDLTVCLSQFTLKRLFLYYSIARKINVLPHFNEGCVDYIEKFRKANGSYKNYYCSRGNIGATFDAIFIKYWILPKYNIEKDTLDYIRACYCNDSGFGINEKKQSISISSTFDGYFISLFFEDSVEQILNGIIKFVGRKMALFSNRQIFQSILILKSVLIDTTEYFMKIY